MGLDILPRDLGGFLHHVAQVAGHGQDPLALGDGTLHEQDLAAHLGPGQAGHHARGLIALLHVVEGRGQAQVLAQVLFLHHLRILLLQGDLLRRHAGDLRDLLLQAADAGLVGVLVDDVREAGLVDLELVLLQAVLLQLLGDEIVLRDLQFLLGQVAGHVDHLHAVLQGRLDGGDAVRRGDEQDVRQVIVDVQVVVVEGAVLLRVQGFQQGAGRVALEVGGELVDLVQDDDRIGRAGAQEAVQDPARKGAHVGFPVAADLRLVVHAAEGDADVLAPEGPCHALSEAGLAHAGRAVQAQDRGLHVPLQLEDGEVLHDAVLHLVQAVVVLVQHLLGVLEVQVVFRHLAPREVQHELDVVVLDAVVRGGGVVLLQARHLLVEDGPDFLGPFLLVRAGAEPVELLPFVHAQFLLDGAELVVQVVLALLLVDVALDLLVDLLLDPQELHLGVQHLQEGHAALVHVAVGEQAHALLEVLHLDGGGDEVHQELEIVDGLEGADGLLRREGGRADDLAGPLLERIGQDLQFVLVLLVQEILLIGDTGDDIWVIAQDRLHVDSLESLQDGRQGAVRHLEGLDHLAHGAVLREVALGGVLDGDVRLRHGAEDSLAGLHVADEADGFLPADGHGEHRAREDDGVAEGQDGDGVGQLGFVQFQQG